jgi:2-hydroxy-3-keto-5-methylthiopentenyl-1-phosphate phosphatase
VTQDKTQDDGVLIQCDFDGTVTPEDMSYLLLDTYAGGDWRALLQQYRQKRISVGRFNASAFTMIKEDEETLKEFVRQNYEVRPGFLQAVDYCHRKGFRFVVVSNGLDFYIKTILQAIGLGEIELHAARTQFGKDGMDARYIDPQGDEMQNDFKKAYIQHFLKQDYRIAYIGNGDSDIPSAGLAHHVFATDALLQHYRAKGLECTPFEDFEQVLAGLAQLGW